MGHFGRRLAPLVPSWASCRRVFRRLGPFCRDLGSQRGGRFSRGDAGSAALGGSALETMKHLARQLTSILTRPYRAGTVADLTCLLVVVVDVAVVMKVIAPPC